MTADAITVVLEGEVVLRRLNLALPAGGITAVVGTSGAGKTTLVRCLVGLRRPDAGRITVGAGAGAEDVVALRTDRCLADLGLTEVADRMPEQLAGHTRRRAAIARALVGDPRLILLDDPDSGLDAQMRARVVDAIRATQARTGATVLITTHDLDLVRSLADTVAVLGEGRILRTGTPAEVLAGLESTEDLAAGVPGRSRTPTSRAPPSADVTTRAGRCPSRAPAAGPS